jgi:hypothetical protein
MYLLQPKSFIFYHDTNVVCKICADIHVDYAKLLKASFTSLFWTLLMVDITLPCAITKDLN